LHHQPGKGAYVLRVAGSKAPSSLGGRVQIVKIAGNKTTVLSEIKTLTRFDTSSGNWSFSADGGYLQASLNGRRIVDAFDESLRGGRAGLYAQRGAVGTPQIRDFTVHFVPARATWAKVPELYVEERQAETMGGWSTPQGFWVNANPISETATPPPAPAVTVAPAVTPALSGAANTKPGENKTDKVLWHKGAFWGDDRLQLKLPDLKDGQTSTLIFNTMAPTGSGTARAVAAVKLSFSLDKSTLKANLTREAGTNGTKTWNGSDKIEGSSTDYGVDIQNRGSFLIVRLRKDKSDNTTTLLAARVS
jgi:hypothetical protein